MMNYRLVNLIYGKMFMSKKLTKIRKLHHDFHIIIFFGNYETPATDDWVEVSSCILTRPGQNGIFGSTLLAICGAKCLGYWSEIFRRCVGLSNLDCQGVHIKFIFQGRSRGTLLCLSLQFLTTTYSKFLELFIWLSTFCTYSKTEYYRSLLLSLHLRNPCRLVAGPIG